MNDNIPTMRAYANDSSYEDIFVEQLKNFLEPDDQEINIAYSKRHYSLLSRECRMAC